MALKAIKDGAKSIAAGLVNLIQSRETQARKQFHELALKEYRGEFQESDFGTLEAVLTTLNKTLDDFRREVSIYGKRDEYKAASKDKDALHAAAVKAAQDRDSQWAETQRILQERAEQWNALSLASINADNAAAKAQRAFELLQAHEFTHREALGIEVDISRVTPTYNGAVGCGDAGWPQYELPESEYERVNEHRAGLRRAFEHRQREAFTAKMQKWNSYARGFWGEKIPIDPPKPPAPATWAEVLSDTTLKPMKDERIVDTVVVKFA